MYDRDEATKSNYHNQYFGQTLSAIQGHVDYILGKLDQLSLWQKMTKTGLAGLHPRLPLIMRHNEFVRATLENVKQNLASMGYCFLCPWLVIR